MAKNLEDVVLTPKQRALAEEAIRRKRLREEEQRRLKRLSDGLKSSLFDKQTEFFESAGKKKLARCSRRAGKTHLAAVGLVLAAISRPGVMVPYITLSIKNARRILWGTLREIERDWAIGMEFKENALTVTLTNGSTIVLGGCQDFEEIEKFRGPKYSLAVIDEAQSMRTSILQKLVEDVIEPATLDFNGEIWMFATPAANASGYFYEADQSDHSSWEQHHWTLLENPHLPGALEWLERRKEENNWSDDDPVYRREYCGEWVRDEDALVYAFSRQKNLVEDIPSEMDFVLGVDLGFVDSTAFVVIGWSPDEPEAYVVHVEKHEGFTATDIGRRILQLNDRFGFLRIVADTGGLGKMIVQELNRRHGLAIEAAEKAQKLGHIELLNSDLRNERLLIWDTDETEELVDELELLEWDPLERLKNRWIERSDCENHAADAMLYAWREALHWLHRKPPRLLEPGTEEYFERLEDEMEEEATRQADALLGEEEEAYYDEPGWEPLEWQVRPI